MADFDNNNQINNNYSNSDNDINNNEAYDAKNNKVDNNTDNSTDNTNSVNGFKVPEYSFYAEQLQPNNYVGDNPQPNNINTANGYNYQPQGNMQGVYRQQDNNIPNSYGRPGANMPNGYGQPVGNTQNSYGQPVGNTQNSYGQPVGNTPNNYGQPGANMPNNYGQPGANMPNSYGQPGSNIPNDYQAQYSNNAANTSNFYPNQYNNTNNSYDHYYNQYNNTGNIQIKKVKKPRRIAKLLKFAGKAACFGLIAALGFFGFHKVYSIINPGASVQNVIDAVDNQSTSYQIAYTEPASIALSDKSIVSEAIDNNLPSIVSITSIITQKDNWFGQTYEVPGSGSGIIVGKTEKEILIATNNHVVEGADKITITFVDGKEAEAIIKGADVAADLAVVALDIDDISSETLNKITVAKLGNSDEVKVGEMAIAIGNALGYGQSATVGYISAKDREVEVSDGYLDTKKMILLQTDAAINPGNSGGALLNSKGEVIGINSVKYAKEEVEGMGFAIPISSATPIINELMSREILSPEEQGFLGITGGAVTEDVAEAYNMPVGVFVNEISEGGPASKAGLQSGDIIIKADDIEITDISQLREYVNSKRVGTDVKITYMRYVNGAYKENTVTITLGKNPNLSETK